MLNENFNEQAVQKGYREFQCLINDYFFYYTNTIRIQFVIDRQNFDVNKLVFCFYFTLRKLELGNITQF